ncbi:hypothetical protein NX779_01755 [Mycoplasma cottewii]|uniref:Uncharacterized protein n=1 Tax=Mycoplasma cottewii TaxID=51364 RepID=A0ABY5TXD7_9MOLU|nr:hypothetical protein [Mycoplasma cottewii]UWD35344.1 hypothetical protein NX779_01755 [Mycoplasma cottewii]
MSTSITLSSRINHTYNNIVNNVKKFDHISSNQININSHDATDATDRSVFPLLDLVSDNSYYNKKTNDKNTSFLNFVLNEKALQDSMNMNNKTLLTEMFSDKTFASFFKDITVFDNNKANASAWSLQLTFYATQFAFDKYNELKNNNQDVNYLKDTVIGKYILNAVDKKTLNEDVSKIKQIGVNAFDKNWLVSPEGQKKVKDLFDTFSPDQKELFSYVYAATRTLIEYITKKIYLEIFNPIVVESNKNLKHKGNDFYNFLVGKNISSDIDDKFETDKDFNGTSEGLNWIINDKNKDYYLNNFEIDKTVIKENEYKIITKDSNIDEQIKTLGMRGMTDLVIADTLKDDSKKQTVVTNIESKINDYSLFKLSKEKVKLNH